MTRRTYLLRALRFLAVGAGIFGVFWVFARMFQSGVSEEVPDFTAADIAEAEAARDVSFDPQDLPSVVVLPSENEQRLVRDQVAAQGGAIPAARADELVEQGQLPAWYPRGESPILAGLVEEGLLPPVAERVGPDPVIFQGPDGLGRFGGTWLRLATTPNDINTMMILRLSNSGLFRWSPLGYPIRPHLAVSCEGDSENRSFVVTLRRGARWSDGEPFDADDILYHWNHEILDPSVYSGNPPGWIIVRGKAPTVEKLDARRVRFTYDAPAGLFQEMLATHAASLTESPEHYLRRYHPRLGDDETIEAALESTRLSSRRSLYTYMKSVSNPLHPRMWPWIYRTYRTVPPQVFVRNPYYFAVDPEGRQLPYVDRLQFDVQDGKQIPISAANGQITMQARHLRYENYTELMSRREEAGTRIHHWYPATRSFYIISPNMNRRVDPEDPSTAWKAKLLARAPFRQALSLAIDRDTIIRAEYNGQVTASQVAPGPESPFRHDGLAAAFIEYDPNRANQLLDDVWRDLGSDPDARDRKGFRLHPDGSRLVFYLDFCAITGIGPAQFVIDDWARVGIRTIPRQRDRALFYTEKAAGLFDFNVWTGQSEFMPLIEPRFFLPVTTESNFAVGWGLWYYLGGFYGSEAASLNKLAQPVPPDHPMYQAIEAYERALAVPALAEQKRHFDRVLDIAAENIWSINLTTPPPQLVVVRSDFRNVPRNALAGYVFRTPSNAGTETYFFDQPTDSPGAIRETREAIVRATPPPDAVPEPGAAPSTGAWMGVLIRRLVWGIGIALLLLVAGRHPFVARRLVIMVPTLLVVSLLIFTVIQLPPGDYLSTVVMQLQESGDSLESATQRLEELRGMFHFDEPGWQRYLRWMGVYWFLPLMGEEKQEAWDRWEVARDGALAEGVPPPDDPGWGFFNQRNEGLLQGNMGRSMETTREVNSMVGDRILLTFLISLGTIMFTWAIAIPIGIFSAVRQYSVADYVFTFIGFIGMCIPSFLLALILMAFAGVSGLFSAEFAAQPEWDLPKVIDLLKHIWIPITVLGITGTAGMIRVMRANLLDELRKPYVTTARAKGVRPVKLLFKYPVRLALNPFVSGIGGIFPQLVSGGAIVAVVLSLPTVGPLMLNALFSQDMYLAGSMLMVLSLLGIFGTLVSDLLLLWLDPRIRYESGGK